MIEEKKLRIGLIGCGRVAENHILSISRCPGAVITAVGGGRHAEELAQRLGVPALPPEEVCTTDLTDAVFVLTPPAYHFTYAMRAIESGKHVMVEKPVSFKPEEPVLLAARAKEKNVVCFPGHSYLYLPEMRRFMDAASGGRLGRICYMYMSEVYYMPPGMIEKYAGPETDVLCHDLYLSLHFLGVPVRISAYRTSFPTEEIPTGGPQVAVMMEYASGAVAQLMISWACEDHTTDPFTFKVRLIGTNASLHFSRSDFMEKEGKEYVQGMYQEMFDREVSYFVREAVREHTAPLSGMEDAALVSRLHNLVFTSINEKRTVEVQI